MKLSLSCTEQELQCLTLSIERLLLTCLNKEYSQRERASLFNAFMKSYLQLLTLFKVYLNQRGFVVCSPKSVFQGALKAGYISEEECFTLCRASEMLTLLTMSYDDENVLLPELLIESEYVPVIIRVANKFS